MKKLIPLSVLLVLSCITVFAKQVDENTAKNVAQRFLASTTHNSSLQQGAPLELVYTAASQAVNPLARITPETFFYVFNAGTQGFVIVAGDDNAIPVLGYSDQGSFDPDRIPDNTRKWLEAYKNQIRYTIDHEIHASPEVQQAWAYYQNGGGPTENPEKTTNVAPLVNTKWNQAPYENGACPGGSVTGCVATAMAQIMKFWEYPATGSGFHSYNHSYYGTLSANFGATTYNWSGMPNVLTRANADVARLMYHCGVSVEMNYSTTASGAYVIDAMSPIQHSAEYALKRYFSYKSTLRGVERRDYNQGQWIGLLKTELDAGRPVLYAGFGSGGGHAFVCDGYNSSNFFHFNWGWGGAYDGYFAVDALNPSGVGTGGGTGSFNFDQQAIIGIEPPSGGGGGGNQTHELALYDMVSSSSSTILYTQPFSISTSVGNFGTSSFSGDFCAAVFDNNNVLIETIDIQSSTLMGGYFDYLTFSTGINSPLGMVPGTYNISIMYRPTGGNWTQVADGSYYNSQQIEVIYYNDIEVRSPITVPGNKFIQNAPGTVTVNFVNEGTGTFRGELALGLYNLDGSLAEIISSYNETAGLPLYSSYPAPLTFSSPRITSSPGTYLLAALFVPDNASTAHLAGSTYEQNPVRVTIQAPGIDADKYEVNNTVAQAYTLPVTFSGNITTTNTTGSNFHIGTDNDFYKINLPADYNYTIKARLHDIGGSGNGQPYTVDALMSYSKDGVSWSDTYDDVITGDITVNGGGTVYFHVAPYFAGSTGTYLLDIGITRNDAAGVTKTSETPDLISVYPNPAQDIVYIDLNGYENKVGRITLVNMQGQELQTVSGQERRITLSLHGLANGMYFIQLQTEHGIITKKITIGK